MDKLRDAMPALLAVLLTLGFLTALAYAMTQVIPPENKDFVMTMLGSLGTVWIGACSYWIGTTHASARKTELMAK